MNFKKPKFWDKKKVSTWAIILLPLNLIYKLFFLLKKISKTSKRFKVPIICVGNIYLGGTGKTPLVREIFNILKSLNKNPAFIKKPYSYLNDEIKMLKATGKVFTSKNRIKSISSSIEQNHNVAILDDGFQDFSIKPDLSILCFNSKQLIGNGFVIPSGPLRENFSSIKRTDCIFINGDKNLNFETKIKKIKKDIKIFYSKYKIRNVEKFKNKNIIAFAGIGNPENFFDLLKQNNLKIEKTISFPDHHNYTEKDFNYLTKSQNDVFFLTTEKDYYRLNDEMKKKCNFIEVDLEIENKNDFINLIKYKL